MEMVVNLVVSAFYQSATLVFDQSGMGKLLLVDETGNRADLQFVNQDQFLDCSNEVHVPIPGGQLISVIPLSDAIYVSITDCSDCKHTQIGYIRRFEQIM